MVAGKIIQFPITRARMAQIITVAVKTPARIVDLFGFVTVITPFHSL